MRIVLLFLFTAYFTDNQVPMVSNYSDFISAVQKREPTAMRISSIETRYGTQLNSEIYQEVLPVDETHVLLINELFETIPNSFVGKRNREKGESFVCLCDKDDLVSILQRWKDGQHGVNDYANFDCKYRSFSDKSKMFKGNSFWQSIQLKDNLLKDFQGMEDIPLTENVKMLVYKNKSNPSKKILKISYDLPVDQVLKEVEAESFLTSVKNDDGVELQINSGVLGWKSLFPEWKEYRKLNAGFWGEPKRRKSILNNRFSKSYAITSNESAIKEVKGQTTFLVKTKEQKSKSLKKLTLKRDGRFIQGEAYLDFGEYINYQINGLSDDNQHVLVAIETDMPIFSVIAYDAQTGIELDKADTLPLELNLPISTAEINIDVVYNKLKKVRVDFSVSQ